MGNGEWGMGNKYIVVRLLPHSLLPTPYSPLPTPHSLLPTPHSVSGTRRCRNRVI
ncbi:MAG: hypothetical protein DSM106950_32035 [Stigonema ocellatum SAG 48.90 = DSM 106950]|nr:hypothetical protein [Stigonema ocellatum SAG 48.90 = DSM 106950]